MPVLPWVQFDELLIGENHPEAADDITNRVVKQIVEDSGLNGDGSWSGGVDFPGFHPSFTGDGSPEGVIIASPGKLYFDSTGADWYYKATGSDENGWTLLVSAPSETGIWYVGKHGDDGNAGDNVGAAFLTIGAAITASSLGDVIVVSDAGVYAENVVLPDRVNLHAPRATISVTSGIGLSINASQVFIRNMLATGTAIGIVQRASGGGEESHVFVFGKIDAGSGGAGVQQLGGTVLHLYADRIFCDAGVGIQADNFGTIHATVGELRSGGDGGSAILTDTGFIFAQITRLITQSPSGTSTPGWGLRCTGGTIIANITEGFVSGFGLGGSSLFYASSGVIKCTAGRLRALDGALTVLQADGTGLITVNASSVEGAGSATPWNIDTGATLNLVAAEVVGIGTGAGTINTLTP